MTFGLKNAEATYQRAMNKIFHDMIRKFMEHLAELRRVFLRMREHHLKRNPLECAFGVSAYNFLGFLIHQRGIKIDKNKVKIIIEARPPKSKKELQRFLSQVNFIQRFISNNADKVQKFSPLLKLKADEKFRWESVHQEAFEAIKRYLASPPVLMPPVKGMPLILYISVSDTSIRSLLAQNNNK